eukprot:366450-Chlamydomonas_euryale.AAC.12
MCALLYRRLPDAPDGYDSDGGSDGAGGSGPRASAAQPWARPDPASAHPALATDGAAAASAADCAASHASSRDARHCGGAPPPASEREARCETPSGEGGLAEAGATWQPAGGCARCSAVTSRAQGHLLTSELAHP